MSFSNQNLVYVYYHGSGPKRLTGRLLLKNRKIFFEYDADFIKTGLELSPFKLPLKPGVIESSDRAFEGLFGVFNDSLPDGWGRLLLDRKLMNAGLNPGTFSPLDRLCFVGTLGMGALSYEPETPSALSHITNDLDEIDSEIQATLDENDAYVEDLLVLGGSSAGARPKVLLNIEGTDWLIKFRSQLDSKDISATEYAYHLMAIDAGLIAPKAKLFPSRKGLGFFGVKRFDRNGDSRIHMHTIAGLLHADHQEPSLDYESIMKATLYLTKDIRQCEIQFRNAVFNILSHNRDDHSKNFSFLMDETGNWTVSPTYDLTFSSGPAGEHSTMIMGEGKNPTKKHLLQLSGTVGIKQDKALEIIDQVLAATQKWDTFAGKVGVSAIQIKNIGDALRMVRKNSGI
ncbi:type II toxin-antitoxin system HipA family toxin [Rickettsiales endosymbiont of Peranema trichophorum]|uniref:type II toxin-antitoxin system HipA family toxin n=1 Tax=Rickettsiales endosymbiont of Peranema trichophorum TaxID=2486577 RepID=UPI0010234437|nr:type II toxin-antitoxin system HipA family toxin [Rickettsiales endosymbiont of Peranema trichophorum]RZI46973.1 type II toxin-antitoxin system HipA family toxin [Rickettsiales endosymbiont of Peranema trichophorum]